MLAKHSGLHQKIADARVSRAANQETKRFQEFPLRQNLQARQRIHLLASCIVDRDGGVVAEENGLELINVANFEARLRTLRFGGVNERYGGSAVLTKAAVAAHDHNIAGCGRSASCAERIGLKALICVRSEGVGNANNISLQWFVVDGDGLSIRAHLTVGAHQRREPEGAGDPVRAEGPTTRKIVL